MYSSYNKFRHNVGRDAAIITSIDTFTSLLAGSTVFGILGHLAYKVGTDDVGIVVKGGPGLAFISYPDAIAKFDWFPQVSSLLNSIARTSFNLQKQFPRVSRSCFSSCCTR